MPLWRLCFLQEKVRGRGSRESFDWGIKGSGLSWQWSKWGDERAAGAEVGDFCVSGGEAGRAEGRCVGQRVVGLGGIKKND